MNPRPCLFTTSWDDGHPADLRIASLLARHGLPGTFYVPAGGQRDCMPPEAVRDLARGFDIGAHTLRHLRLNALPEAAAGHEIRASKAYLEDLLGRPCAVFAPPGGRFSALHLRLAAAAGFAGFRTTELLSLAPPARRHGLAVLATTLQVFNHRWPAYWRNALSRGRPANLLNLIRGGDGPPDRVFARLLDHAITHGGVVHLWGHSWEIESTGAWECLEAILATAARRRGEIHLLSNSALSEGARIHGDLTLAATNSLLPR